MKLTEEELVERFDVLKSVLLENFGTITPIVNAEISFMLSRAILHAAAQQLTNLILSAAKNADGARGLSDLLSKEFEICLKCYVEMALELESQEKGAMN